MAAKRKHLEPIHPGEILLEDFMKPMGISINRLARDIDRKSTRLNSSHCSRSRMPSSA